VLLLSLLQPKGQRHLLHTVHSQGFTTHSCCCCRCRLPGTPTQLTACSAFCSSTCTGSLIPSALCLAASLMLSWWLWGQRLLLLLLPLLHPQKPQVCLRTFMLHCCCRCRCRLSAILAHLTICPACCFSIYTANAGLINQRLLRHCQQSGYPGSSHGGCGGGGCCFTPAATGTHACMPSCRTAAAAAALLPLLLV
jgi:hypothetical protein